MAVGKPTANNMVLGREKTARPRRATPSISGDARARGTRPKGNPPQQLDPLALHDFNARLSAAWHWLQNEDQYRTAGWAAEYETIWLLLREADKRRKEGDLTIDSGLVEKLRDSQSLHGLHQRFELWKNGSTRFSTARPLKLNRPRRLTPYDRQIPVLCEKEGKPPSTYTSLIPRPREVTNPPFVNLPTYKGEADWKSYFGRVEARPMLRSYMVFYDHANLWGQHDPPLTEWGKAYSTMKNSDNPQGVNLAQFENMIFEQCVGQKWADFAQLYQELSNEKTTTALVSFAIHRGIRRAAIQKVLNSITNDENKNINTPWRRVIFPEPIKDIRQNHFHPWALARREFDKDEFGHIARVRQNRHTEGEPSPWIYWFDEWRRQESYLSAWTRQSYYKRYWTDFKKIALPINSRGPYTFNNKCVYDEYWLKLGRNLMTLQANLEKLVMMSHDRWILEWVVDDIKHGECGDPIGKEVVPRPNVDLVGDEPDKYQLIDDVDVAWLKLLCQPATTKALAEVSQSKPMDALTVILDHRLQALFNDPLHNPFWVTDTSAQENEPSFRPWEMSLEHLLPMINLGSRDFGTIDWTSQGIDARTEYQKAPQFKLTGVPIPNSLYQFSLKEAKLHCTKLAEMGRIAYKRPEDPEEFREMWWSGKGNLYYYPDINYESLGGFVVPVTLTEVNWSTKNNKQCLEVIGEDNAVRYPEERIRWRYPHRAAFDEENDRQRQLYTTELARRNKSRPDAQLLKEFQEENFLPETIWVQGPAFDERSVEALRESPSWEDILDNRTVLAPGVGYSNRTTNFLRILAYRMGRTIRHCKSLQNRVSKPSSLTRQHLHESLENWKFGVENTWLNEENSTDATLVPFRLGSPKAIIAKCNPGSKNRDRKFKTTVFKEIREGIINDMVKNRTMQYPSRRTLYTDKHKFIGAYYERAKIWSWASHEIREHHAAYRRESYFDMRRWPVNRQPNESTRTSITTRADEDPSIQPVSAFYKYNIKVGPAKMVPEHSDMVSQLVGLLQDPDKMTIAEQLIHHVSKELVKIVKDASGFGPEWEIRVAPPGTKITPSHNVDVCTASSSGSALSLKPMVRPKQRFIPGPALFPMGDTFLQQLKISHDLERILDPKPQTTLNTIASTVAEWLVPPPERVALLPEIDLAKAPSTSRLNLKRKVNTAFITSDGRAPKRQVLHRIGGKEIDRSNGRGGNSGGGNDNPPESDGEWTDSDSDFDHLLPYSAVSAGKVSVTHKKKDGTFTIKVKPDLDKVMKIDIAHSKIRSVTRSGGGRPPIRSGFNQSYLGAPKPTARAREARINSPIVQSTETSNFNSETVRSKSSAHGATRNNPVITKETSELERETPNNAPKANTGPSPSFAPTGRLAAEKSVSTTTILSQSTQKVAVPLQNPDTRHLTHKEGNGIQWPWGDQTTVTLNDNTGNQCTTRPVRNPSVLPQTIHAGNQCSEEVKNSIIPAGQELINMNKGAQGFSPKPIITPRKSTRHGKSSTLQAKAASENSNSRKRAQQTESNLQPLLTVPTQNTNAGHSGGLSSKAMATYQERADMFDQAFPYGATAIVKSGSRLLCALHAIVGSMATQFPHEKQPTVDELYESYLHPANEDIKKTRKEVGLINRNDLSLDQATATLYDWGLGQGRVYQLGTYLPSAAIKHMIMEIPPQSGVSVNVLWIQNNMTQANIDADIRRENDAIVTNRGPLSVHQLQNMWQGLRTNHYSGLSKNQA